MVYIFLFAGFVLLLLGGNFLVKGAVSIAVRLNISKLIVGVVIVSIGTSLPELFVSVGAALKGSSDIALSNVIGSNIANIALVLGLTALIFSIPVKSSSVLVDWPVMLLASVVLWLFMMNGVISWYEGVALLLLLGIYMFILIRKERKTPATAAAATEVAAAKPMSLWLSLLMIAGACTSLYFGADLLVDNARFIAKSMGVSERIIGLTIVALGTSVPELTTSLVAAYKKEMDISVGNIIGSNIFNIFLVIGCTASVHEIHVAPKMNSYDIYWMMGIAVLLLLTMLPARRSKIKRLEGGILVLSYALYLYFLL